MTHLQIPSTDSLTSCPKPKQKQLVFVHSSLDEPEYKGSSYVACGYVVPRYRKIVEACRTIDVLGSLVIAMKSRGKCLDLDSPHS